MTNLGAKIRISEKKTKSFPRKNIMTGIFGINKFKDSTKRRKDTYE
jgi:hypothetical protein